MGVEESVRYTAAVSNLELVREGVSRRTGNVSTQVRSTVDGMVLVADVEAGQSVIESNTFNEGTTIAVITHDTTIAASLPRQVSVFDGRIESDSAMQSAFA